MQEVKMTRAIMKIKKYITDNNISAVDLAKKLGVPKSTLCRWVNSDSIKRRIPRRNEQERINKIFGIINEWVDK